MKLLAGEPFVRVHPETLFSARPIGALADGSQRGFQAGPSGSLNVVAVVQRLGMNQVLAFEMAQAPSFDAAKSSTRKAPIMASVLAHGRGRR